MTQIDAGLIPDAPDAAFDSLRHDEFVIIERDTSFK